MTRTSLATVHEFLSHRRLAMVGLSRDPGSFSARLFTEMCRRGYDMVPVNPRAGMLLGRPCFARLQDIEPAVEGALLMTSPDTTRTVVHDCAEAGIPRLWMYRAGGEGAVDAQALHFCRELGIAVVAGECPLMFLPGAGILHSAHGLVRKITRRYPPRAGVAA